MSKGKTSLLLWVGALAAIFVSVSAGQAQINGASEFSGRATGMQSVITPPGGPSSTTTTGDTCPLPARGGTSVVTTSGPLVFGIVGSGSITSSTSGIGLTSQSSSSVSDFVFRGGGWDIRARNVTTNTQCNCCDIAAPQCSGETNVSGLTIVTPSGMTIPYTVTVLPNQVLTLPGGAGTITFNERPTTPAGSITVIGMHINITAGGTNYNIEIARSHSDIQCAQGVITPAHVNVSGRVLTADGLGVARATISLTDNQGNVLTSVSNASGNYTIPDVTAGRTYVLTAQRRGLTFPQRVVTVLDELTDVDIIASGN